MIIDTLDNLARYESLYPLIAEVVAFMKNHDLESLEAGMHPIKGEVAVARRAPTNHLQRQERAVCAFHTPRRPCALHRRQRAVQESHIQNKSLNIISISNYDSKEIIGQSDA